MKIEVGKVYTAWMDKSDDNYGKEGMYFWRFQIIYKFMDKRKKYFVGLKLHHKSEDYSDDGSTVVLFNKAGQRMTEFLPKYVLVEVSKAKPKGWKI